MSHLLLEVECWCRATIVRVEPGMVRAGQTRTCGRPDCTSAKVKSA